MELFLPSLLGLLVAALFAFAVVPQFGPLSLTIVSLLALAGVGVHHYMMFSTEYRMSTWQDMIRSYASYIALGVALLLSALYLLQMFAYGSYSSPAAKNAANATANAGILGAAAASIGAAASAITGSSEASVPANLGEQKTILEQATDMAAKSLQAMPNLKTTAAPITNPIVAAVNKGMNAVLGTSTSVAKREPTLPFSPSDV